MIRKITCNRTRKLIAIKEKVSLYSNQITFSYNQWLHLGSTQYKQFPQKKKDGRSLCGRKRKRENETWKKRRKEERENERKEKERKEVEKRRIRKGMERVCGKEREKGE